MLVNTTIRRVKTCDADDIPTLSEARARETIGRLSRVEARIETAIDLHQEPSSGLLAELRLARATLLEGVVMVGLEATSCSWSGEVDVLITGGSPAQYDTQWICPACGTIHEETLTPEEDRP